MPIQNPYAAFTPIGAAMSNLANAILAAPGKQDERALRQAQMEAARSEAALREAQANKAYIEGDEIQARIRGRADAEGTYRRGLGIPEVGPPTTEQGDMLGDFLRGRAAADAGYGQSKADDIDKAIAGERERRLANSIIAGRQKAGPVAQARFATSGGPAPFAVQDHTLVDLAQGMLGPVTQPGKAEIGLKGAQAGAANARARAANAQGALYDDKRINPDRHHSASERLVPVLDASGTPVWAPASEAAGKKVGKTAAGERRLKIAKHDRDAAEQGIAALFFDEDFPIDASKDPGVKAGGNLAASLYADPDSPTYGDMDASVAAAADQLGIEPEKAGEWNPFSANRTRLKVTRQQNAPTAAPAQQPAAQAVPAPQQRVPGKVYQTPKGPMVWTGTGWVPAGT